MTRSSLGILGSTCAVLMLVALGACGDDSAAPAETLDAGETEADAATTPDAAEDSPTDSGRDASADADAAPASICGDSLISGDEDCDDGDSVAGDGCDSACHLEPGWECPPGGAPCTKTTCGDGLVRGTEACDSGKHDWSDGCTPDCTPAPACANGTCTAICGDGIVAAGEACDDGNNRSWDGCSKNCTVEPGFTCALLADAPPATLPFTIVHRDFRGFDLPAAGGLPRGHIDFESANGAETGIIQALLATDGKPAYGKDGIASPTTHGKASFDQWFYDTPNVNVPVVGAEAFTYRAASGSYRIDSSEYFPVDAAGFVAQGKEPLRGTGGVQHNFSSTTEIHAWFRYAGTELLTIRGDDDIWIYVNGRLAVDLGGVHNAMSANIDLPQRAASLGIAQGNIYELAIFRAERHTSGSSLLLEIPVPRRSVCTK